MAIEKIRARMLRAAAALEIAGIDYAVVGGNAVAEWVGRVDETAVRFTRGVDILLHRQDLENAIEALAPHGFEYQTVFGVPMFIDGPDGTTSNAIHVLFSCEKIRDSDSFETPDLRLVESGNGFRVIDLESLVKMKLTAFRRKDQVHLEDMLNAGVIDPCWVEKLPRELADRLQFLIDNPE